jgi:hypothetical protein
MTPMTRKRRFWAAGAAGATLALLVVAMLHAGASTHAASAKNSSPYNKPRWWAKYQIVSAPGFTPTAPGKGGSVTVGTNVNVSHEPGPQSETSIAINPANPSQLVGGANEIFRLPMRGYFSSDGGATWGGVDLPLPPPVTNNGFDFGSDPGVAWDLHGNVYYSYIIVFFSNGGAINGTEMAVSRSSDGGQTWTATYFNFESGEAQFNDKPMITVDNNPGSPHEGTIYVAWDNATGSSSSSNNLLVSHSTDHGVTFSAPAVASDTTSGPKAVIAADPFVGPDGTLFVAWHDVQNSAIVASSSSDGGVSFGPQHTVSPTQIAFDFPVPAESSRGALLYPACDADRSTGPNRGTLYCSWMDQTASNATDVFITRSTNGGASWSRPQRVNDDAAGVANDQFNQWLAVDSTDGSVNVSWSDTRNDPTHLSTDEYFSRSTDGGQTFIANVRVSTASTNETCCGANLGDQYGDYEGIAAFGGVVHPIWTDRRDGGTVDGFEETYTAAITTKKQ